MTRVAVKADSHRARLDLVTDVFAPRVVRSDARGAVVALVATQGMLLGGDHLAIDIEVGPGAWLEIVEVAGLVAFDAAGEPSSLTMTTVVGEDARLRWGGEPMVISDGANVLRSSRFDLGVGAVAAIRETLVLGRAAEFGGSVRGRLEVNLPDGPLLLEELALGSDRTAPGLLGECRIIDTAALFGVPAPLDPVVPAGCRFDLEGPGTVGRYLGISLADSPVPHWWARWSEAAALPLHRERG